MALTYYADTSALAKLVVEEVGSPELFRFLDGSLLVSASIAWPELIRTARRRGVAFEMNARTVLDDTFLVPLDLVILESAAMLEPTLLRSLDAIHIAAALSIREDLDGLLTYDRRMIEAAAHHGLPVASPGMATA